MRMLFLFLGLGLGLVGCTDPRKRMWDAQAQLDAERALRSYIELFVAASVPGTQVHAYFGPIEVEMFLRDRDVTDRDLQWREAQLALLERLSDLAREKQANAVVGLEVSLDPFASCSRTGESGLQLSARGTPARLEFL